jgi:hypothetical protein
MLPCGASCSLLADARTIPALSIAERVDRARFLLARRGAETVTVPAPRRVRFQPNVF